MLSVIAGTVMLVWPAIAPFRTTTLYELAPDMNGHAEMKVVYDGTQWLAVDFSWMSPLGLLGQARFHSIATAIHMVRCLFRAPHDLEVAADMRVRRLKHAQHFMNYACRVGSGLSFGPGASVITPRAPCVS